MELQRILSELSMSSNFGNIELGSTGAVAIMVDENLRIEIESQEDGAFTRLIAVLGSTNVEDPLSTYENCLTANFTSLTRGNCIGVDVMANEVLMYTRIEMEYCETEQFSRHLESFINDYEHWKNKFENAEIGHRVGDGSSSAATTEHHDANSLGMGLRV